MIDVRKKQLINQLHSIADELDKQNVPESPPDNLQTLHENIIRPLLESRIIKNIEVAKMLKVSPSTVASLIAEGYLSTTSDGKVTEYHLLKYLTNNK